MATTTNPSQSPSSHPPPPKAKHPIPPQWYALQTTNTPNHNQNHPYVALPPTSTRPPTFLTPFYRTDAPAMQAALSIPTINTQLISVPYPYTLSDAHYWLDLQHKRSSTSPSASSPGGTGSSLTGSGPWLQALRIDSPAEDGPFIGCVSLTPADSSSYALAGLRREAKEQDGDGGDGDDESGSYVLGYYLHPSQQQRGIIRDAVRALIAWGLAERGVKKVRADIVVENGASRAVVEGIKGFERVKGEEVVWVEWPETKGGGRRGVASWVWRDGK